MGGRGASSKAGRGGEGPGGGIGAGGGNGSGGVFYDRTAEFSGMSMHDFENEIRSRKVEYIGVYDDKGNLIVAGTSNRKGSVAMPPIPAGVDKSTLTITHNHPSGGDRAIGGALSAADVKAFASNGFRQMRAVASGRGEHTYMMTRTSAANPVKLHRLATEAQKIRPQIGNSKVYEVESKFKTQGKQFSDRTRSGVYLGAMKKYWYSAAEQSGYSYVILKNAPW